MSRILKRSQLRSPRKPVWMCRRCREAGMTPTLASAACADCAGRRQARDSKKA